MESSAGRVHRSSGGMDSLCGWHESSTRAASQWGVAAGCAPARTHRRRARLHSRLPHLLWSRHTGPVSWSWLRGVFGIWLERDEDQFTITARVLVLLQADSNCHLESKKGENILPSSTKTHAITTKMSHCTSYVNSWPQSLTQNDAAALPWHHPCDQMKETQCYSFHFNI